MKRPLTPAELDRLFAPRPISPQAGRRKRKAAGVGPRELEARRVREEMATFRGKS